MAKFAQDKFRGISKQENIFNLSFVSGLLLFGMDGCLMDS
jgi:hypothetical protein